MPTKKRLTSKPARHALRFTPVALAAILVSQPALSVTRTWDAGGGGANPFWDLVANWNTGLPLAGDIAAMGAFNTTIRNGNWALQSMSGTGALSITAGNLSVNAASTMGSMALSGGSFGGSGNLTVGAFAWTGGDLGNATALGGDLNVNGAATINASNHYINYGQALNLKNNSTWGPNGYLYMYGTGVSGGNPYGESTVNLSAGKTLSLQGGDTSAYYQIAGPGTFNNAGIVTKTGTNLLYVDSNFNNTGTINVNGGEVRFRNTRTVGGTINTTAGTMLRFDGSTTFDPAIAITGNGDIAFDGTYNLLTSGSRTFGGTGTKTFVGGTLGGAGTLVVNNLTWLNGTMGHAGSLGGVTTVNGDTTLSSATKYVHYGRTLNLNGDVTWDANGALYLYGAGISGGTAYGDSTVNLAAGKTLSMDGNASQYDYLYGPGIFNNAGTVTRNGTGIFYVDSVFNNTGIVNANVGEIQFRQTRTIGGTLNVAADAALHFNGSTTFATALVVAGDGNLIFNGTYNVLTAGNKTFANGAGTKTLVSGVLGGAGQMQFDNLTWLGGSMGYAGSVGGITTVNGITTLSSTTHYLNYGRTLNLKGNTTWDANGTLYMYGAGISGGIAYGESVATLFTGKVLTMAGNASSYDQIHGPGTFNNNGTINKNGTGVFYIDSNFNNVGTINTNAGETQFRGTRTIGGKLNVASGAAIRFNGNTTFDPGLVLLGAGKLFFDGSSNLQNSGTRTFGGGGTKTFVNGTLGGGGTMVFDNLTWLNGTMGAASSFGGTTTVTGKTILSSATHYLHYGRTLNLGDTTWDANGALYIYGAGVSGGSAYAESTANLGAGKTLTMAGNASSYDQIHGPGTFNNNGTINKSGTGVLYVDSKFNNVGSVNATKGSIQFRNTINNTGTLFANGGRIDVTTTTGLTQWNLTTQTLTGGTFRVTGTQPIGLNLGNIPATSTPALIKTNQAKIYLSGAGAAIMSTTPDPDVNALTTLATNSGTLSLLGGATLATTVALKNSGTGLLTVGSGSTLTVGASGLYRQSDTASTFLGGTLSLKAFAFDSGLFSVGNASGLVGNGLMIATGTGLTMGALASYRQDLTSAGWDKLAVQTGNVLVDGSLVASFGAGVGAGTYRFLTTDTGFVNGSFDSVTSNLSPGLFTVSAIYGTKFVDLKVTAVPAFAGAMPSAVPEPETYAMLLAGLGLIGWQVRRRKVARKD